MEKRIVVCDKCGTEGQRYVLTYAGDTYVADLCSEHGEPVIEAMKVGTKQRPRAPRKRTQKVDAVPKLSHA